MMTMTMTMYRTAVPELRLLSTALPGTRGGQAKLQVLKKKHRLHTGSDDCDTDHQTN